MILRHICLCTLLFIYIYLFVPTPSCLVTLFYQVAAIFKIGNSKDTPEIPDHLSNDAKNFIRLCLQRNPALRPTAFQLLEHPFLRVHAARVANTKDASPRPFDGSCTMVMPMEVYYAYVELDYFDYLPTC